MSARTLIPGGIVALTCFLAAAAQAADVRAVAEIYRITKDGRGAAVGGIVFADTEHGLLVTPDLRDMRPAGPHALHVHEKASCAPGQQDGDTVVGGSAGSHYDPQATERHEGPYGDGHLGDLPNLVVECNGDVTIPVLAPRPSLADVRGRAVMIHAKPDRYGGHASHRHGKGGARMYCGVIE